ncbi:hypothetical protein D3C73_1521350 [compost metagenome]
MKLSFIHDKFKKAVLSAFEFRKAFILNTVQEIRFRIGIKKILQVGMVREDGITYHFSQDHFVDMGFFVGEVCRNRMKSFKQ